MHFENEIAPPQINKDAEIDTDESPSALTSAEWDEYRQKIDSLKNALLAKAREKIADDPLIWYNDQLVQKSRQLAEKYADHKLCLAWHAISYSTAPFTGIRQYLDFPEPDNVEGFLKKLNDKLDENSPG